MTTYDTWLKFVLDNYVIAALLILFGFVVGVSTFLASLSLIRSKLAPILRSLGWIKAEPNQFWYKGQEIRYMGTGGISKEEPIKILGANSPEAGVAATWHWIKFHYPDYDVISRGQLRQDKGSRTEVDFFRIRSKESGWEREIYFDVSEFKDIPMENHRLRKAIEKSFSILQKVREDNPGVDKFTIRLDGEKFEVLPSKDADESD